MEGRATQGEGQRESCSPGEGCASCPSHRLSGTPTPTPPHTHREWNWEVGGVGADSRVKVFRVKERTLKTGKPAEQSGQGVSRG